MTKIGKSSGFDMINPYLGSASAIPIDSASISGRIKQWLNNWYLQFPCMAFSNKKNQGEVSTTYSVYMAASLKDRKSIRCLLADKFYLFFRVSLFQSYR